MVYCYRISNSVWLKKLYLKFEVDLMVNLFVFNIFKWCEMNVNKNFKLVLINIRFIFFYVFNRNI